LLLNPSVEANDSSVMINNDDLLSNAGEIRISGIVNRSSLQHDGCIPTATFATDVARNTTNDDKS